MYGLGRRFSFCRSASSTAATLLAGGAEEFETAVPLTTTVARLAPTCLYSSHGETKQASKTAHRNSHVRARLRPEASPQSGYQVAGRGRRPGLGLALVAPGSVIALVAYAGAGQVDWRLGIPLAVGGVVAISAGVAFAHSLPERRLRFAFCGLLVLIAALLALHG